jgi:hypothetical protein
MSNLINKTYVFIIGLEGHSGRYGLGGRVATAIEKMIPIFGRTAILVLTKM